MGLKRFLSFAVILGIIFSFSAIAQDTPVSKKADPLKVQAGIVTYPDPRTGPEIYIEFPFSVNRGQFEFLPDSTGALIAGIYADLLLKDTLGNPVDSASTYFLTRCRDSSEIAQKDIHLFNRLYLMLPPGVYNGELTVIDPVSKNEGLFYYDRIEIDSIRGDDLNISGIEFAHSIKIVDPQKSKGSRLVKNGREVIPNPMGIYSHNDSILYVYAEIYNIPYEEENRDSLILSYKVFTATDSLYTDYGQVRQLKPGSSSVVSNMLNIRGIEPGKYDLKLIALDPAENVADTSSARFVVFPPQSAMKMPPEIRYNISHPYDTASLETRRQLVRFLLAPQEMAMLNSLNDSGKIRYINQFLNDKDPDPDTPENEFMIDLYRRYIYANENFSSLPETNDGWQTDRGRILLQYGTWDERDEYTAPSYGKPWEKWTYHSIQGGVIFVFQDIDGYGNYRLVHSTASGEIYNASWEEVLKDNDPGLY